jgi:hypothetical protein
MTELPFQPLLECEGCHARRYHRFVRTEIRQFLAANGRENYTKEYREQVSRRSTMYMLVYSCCVCGKERCWGNSIDDVKEPKKDLE